ncbi:hypothetical protein HPB52_014017 [Rhipicephalus sanguineus]|uniref:Uncharacterized protein n=1 Tax=Rhipicephalus sanguineus TaxID=34632 RepID=A0A9D4Q069_RHISA|nr:hypothetical protein HPB52_014017 [Rhipicephalus sanguineus]
MDKEKFIALGRELGLEKAELREWVEKECALARDERAREREEAKESAEWQRLLQEQELKILELKLKLQESAGRQSAEANEPGGATSSVTSSTTRAPEVYSLHKLIPPFDETRDDLDAYLQRFERLSKSDKTFNGLRDLIIAEQFTESCLPALRVFLKERNCRTLQEIEQTSDNFMDAQSLLNLGKERACRGTGPTTSPRMELARKTPRADDLSRSVLPENIENVPIVKGFMDKRPVTILRDTGCDTVVVRQALVPKEKLTVRNLPEAVVFLDTPLFKGEVRAHCLRDSLYDVVLGNITGAISFDNTRVMKTRTFNPSSSADIEEKTPKTSIIVVIGDKTRSPNQRYPDGVREEMSSNGTSICIVAAIDLAMAEFATGCDALPQYS